MKKLLLSLSFTGLIFSNGFSQTFLLNSDVYDFSVGDVFQTYSYGTGLSPLLPQYVTKEVQTKTYSAAFDTVFYNMKRTTYNPPLCSLCTGTTIIDTISQSYTNLTQPVNMMSLPILISDTVYTDFCNRNTWKITSNSFPNAVGEINTFEHYVVSGCGGLYFNRIYGILGPATEHYNLVYYKKDSVECGTITVGINEATAHTALAISPNPSSGLFTVNGFGDMKEGVIEIYNVLGEKITPLSCRRGAGGEVIDLSNQAKGIYFVRVTAEGKSYSQKIVIE